ncbi:uncharacterized protein LOC129771187 [Toxorhynchites rutilus septentrionalis]|uniref:uncharacterized protein LOC129771187 n=1 Tax=Toxorhynchites rutilus septentrionalis TaxID=329112 RepID=UPI002478A46E|nr:uncharacterized protein LOC129771187 [Toxorhynchites rutilus septentrionalis]
MNGTSSNFDPEVQHKEKQSISKGSSASEDSSMVTGIGRQSSLMSDISTKSTSDNVERHKSLGVYYPRPVWKSKLDVKLQNLPPVGKIPVYLKRKCPMTDSCVGYVSCTTEQPVALKENANRDDSNGESDRNLIEHHSEQVEQELEEANKVEPCQNRLCDGAGDTATLTGHMEHNQILAEISQLVENHQRRIAQLEEKVESMGFLMEIKGKSLRDSSCQTGSSIKNDYDSNSSSNPGSSCHDVKKLQTDCMMLLLDNMALTEIKQRDDALMQIRSNLLEYLDFTKEQSWKRDESRAIFGLAIMNQSIKTFKGK